MSFKTKLIVAFVSIELVIFIIGVSIFYFSFKNLLYERIEVVLIAEAEEFNELIEYRADSLYLNLVHEWNEFEHTQTSKDAIYTAIIDNQGKTIEKSKNLGLWELQNFVDFESSPEMQIFNMKMDSRDFMCVVFPAKRGDVIVAYILMASSLEQTNEYLAVIKNKVKISFFVITFLGFLFAYLLANRIVKPVLAIKHEAGKISLKNLNKRIKLLKADSEIEILVKTLNNLFDRLEKSFNQINDFSSNVSHELRTPLTILRGNIEVALSKERSKEEYMEILAGLLEESMHLTHIVDNLFLLARADSGSLPIKKDLINLKKFCDEYHPFFESICATKKQLLNCDIEEKIAINGDKYLLAQLLLNLISNASKYSAEAQPIEVTIGNNNGSSGKNGFVKIAVTDYGVGMTKVEQEKVFERFYRVQKDRSRESGGAGLGLPICKMIAKRHDGSISIDSKVGKGTTVKVEFPSMLKS